MRCRPDAQGNWTGFNTDFCRALAAAIFDDPKTVQLISLSSKDRLTALQSARLIAMTATAPWKVLWPMITSARTPGNVSCPLMGMADQSYYAGDGLNKALS